MSFFEFPYTRTYSSDLGWLIRHVKWLTDEVENKTIKYADPIEWNITSQYEKNTVVIDGTVAYLSKEAVPSGVAITDSRYWQPIFDIAPIVEDVANIRDQISVNHEETVTSTHHYNIGDWLFIDDVHGKPLLYYVIREININDGLVNGYNVNKVTVEDIVKAVIDTIGDLTNLTTADKSTVVNAINELDNDIGALTNLPTTDKSSIVNAIGEIDGNIGSLSNLPTTDKSSIVNAIDEIDGNIGSLSNLTTTDKSSIVNAINEVADKEPTYINIRNYGAVSDGTTDCLQALKDAITAAGTNGVVYIPQGKYLLSGQVELSNITIKGCSILDGDTPFNNGSTFVIKQNTVSPFKVLKNVVLDGIGFYYPDQNGSTATPLSYPPTLLYKTIINVIIRNCVFYNAYVGIAPDTSSGTIGRIIIENIYAYCVSNFINIRRSRDTISISNSFITAGVFQDIALTGNKYLAKYTANNGKAILINDSCDDLKVSNVLIWGYRFAVYLASDANCNMLKLENVHSDGTQSFLYTENGCVLNNTLVDGCEIFTINTLYTSASENAFHIHATSDTAISISDTIAEIGFRFMRCASHLRDLSMQNVEIHGIPSDTTGMILDATTLLMEGCKIKCNGGSSGNRAIYIDNTPYAIINGVILENGQVGIDANNMTALVIANTLSINQETPYGLTNVSNSYISNNNFT